MRLPLIPIVSLLLTASAQATTFTVKVNSDSGANSLRQAITDANADASATVGAPHRIVFAIGSGGAQTIVCDTPLPTLTRPTVIDGATQPGFSSVPLIEVTFGAVAASTSGLRVQADASVIRALAINGFGANGYGILVSASSSNVIEACRIGCDRLATGVVALKARARPGRSASAAAAPTESRPASSAARRCA